LRHRAWPDLDQELSRQEYCRHGSDKVFAGSIPEIYERFLVPLIFEPYALDLARRVRAANPQSLLETAAGTGVVMS
jgi:hypothetical protein